MAQKWALDMLRAVFLVALMGSIMGPGVLCGVSIGIHFALDRDVAQIDDALSDLAFLDRKLRFQYLLERVVMVWMYYILLAFVTGVPIMVIYSWGAIGTCVNSINKWIEAGARHGGMIDELHAEQNAAGEDRT